MWLLQVLRLRLRSLFRRGAVDRELEDEIRFHLDLQIQENLNAGMEPAEARNAALRQFDHPTQRKEECRDARRIGWIEDFLDDVRYAIRGQRRDPLLVLAATLTLAIGIGANTTVFSIADSILIRPLPYPSSERIDWITERSGPSQRDVATAPDYYRLREQNRVFEEVAAFNPITVNWTGVERPEQLDAATVSASFFPVMGSQPMMGRYLAPQEEGTKAPAVAVISYEFWRNRLGSDPHVLGTTIGLNRLPHTIIGVMPQGFDFPRGTQVWTPLDIDESSGRIISPNLPIRIVSIVARRKPGITPEQAEAEMHRLTLAIRAEYLSFFPKTGFHTDLVIRAIPLQQYLTGPLRPALLMLIGAVGLVLLIACFNLATLLLARAESRRRELAVRLALGSHRGRIVRQMLTESLVIALPGGIAGMAVAWLAVRVLNATKPAILVRYPAISVDLRVLVFTVVLTLATGVFFGIVPALSAASTRIQDALQSAGLTHTAGRGAARLRKALVTAELGISLVLLIGAGLLARSFLNLVHTELGFRSDHLLTFRVTPIGPFGRDYSLFYQEILDRLKQLPGSRGAALLSDVPLSDDNLYQILRIHILGRPVVPLPERPAVNSAIVSLEFFSTLEVPLKKGRIFDSHDFVQSSGAKPVVVNESLVRRIFPGEDPLGRQISFGLDENKASWIIVGVIANIRGGALGVDPPPIVYRCTCSGSSVFRAAFVVRTTGEPRSIVRAVEQQVRAVDRDQPISDVKTMDERKDAALAPERFQLILIGIFALIAIFLAAAGVYGTMSYLVARRTREIGIRMAMGARPADVFRMIVGETVVLVFWAVAIGLGGAWALTRYIRFMLFGVTGLDALTFSLTPILLAIIVLIASFTPARRALRIDPMRALREE